MDSIFEKFFNNFVNPVNKEKFESWINDVANKISEIALNLDDEELINTILDDTSFDDYNDTLLMMFKGNIDIEKAAYEILSIMIKNKRK